MDHRILIQPSGHQFHAAPQETLLEAALRSGINLDYHCSSGSCGDCRVRLLQGQLGPSEFHDFRFSAVEKAQGYALLCTSHAASDLVIEAHEASIPSDIPLQSLQAKIAKVETVSPTRRILHLRTPRSQTLRFLAGQHVQLSIPGIGSLDSAIASCPCNGMQLQFHLHHLPGVPFLDYAFTSMRSGETLQLQGPYGSVTLDDDSRRPLLMVAVEDHFAPIKSLLEHAVNLDLPQPIRFVWYAEKGGHFLLNHCRAWGEALDDYRFIPLEGNASLGMTSVLEVIGDEAPGIGGYDIYLAGPEMMRQPMHHALMAMGAEGERIFMPRLRSGERPWREATGS